MFAQGKNVVLMTCSIHATEVASTHSAVEFAYKMLTDESPRFQTIRQNTILILVPSLESGWRRYRDAVVPQNTGHEVRRHAAAGAVAEVRGPRQQPRLVHLFPARDPRHHFAASQRVASGDRLRRAPARARTLRGFSFRRGWIRLSRMWTRFSPRR